MKVKDLLKKRNKKYDYRKSLPGQLRVLTAVLIIIFQIIFILYLVAAMRTKAISVYLIMQALGVLMAIFVVRNQRSSAYSTPWVILLLLAPPVGVLLYAIWGRQSIFNHSRRLLKVYIEENTYNPSAADSLGQLPELSRMPQLFAPLIQIKSQTVAPAIKLHEFDPNQDLPRAYSDLPLPSRLLTNWGFPIYQGNQCRYFPSGQDQFETMFDDLRQAKKFIFAEYYIINEGAIWDEFVEIAVEKSRAGLEVKLLFDDLACSGRINRQSLQTLTDAGVEVVRFNPILSFASRLYINYRNHQKLCLIDGNLAYFSGTNLADEYANFRQPFGYWKDCAIRVEGPAAWAALNHFFMMWSLANGKVPQDQTRYLPDPHNPLQVQAWDDLVRDGLALPEAGLTPRGIEKFKELYQDKFAESAEYRRSLNPLAHVIPFWDGPVNNPHNIGEDLYLSLITAAQDRIIINTPYFIVDEHFSNTLCRAAASGVNVSLIVPGIADKFIINQTTKASYEDLLRSGVKIYEYSPGFNHDKTIMVDGTMAVTGTMNFDYRSFNLNYENGIYLYLDPEIAKIEQDLLNSISQSHEIRLSDWVKRPFTTKLIQDVFKIFAPLF